MPRKKVGEIFGVPVYTDEAADGWYLHLNVPQGPHWRNLEAVAEAARAVHTAATSHAPFDVTGRALRALGVVLDVLDESGIEAIDWSRCWQVE